MADQAVPLVSPHQQPGQLKAGAALSYAAMVAGFLVAMVFTPVMLRLLGQTEYGLYSLVASLASYLGMLGLVVNSTYLRLYARYRATREEAEIARANGLLLLMMTGLGVITLVVAVVLAANARTILGNNLSADELARGRDLILILGGGAAVSLPLSVFESHVIAKERFVFQKVLAISRTILGPAVIAPVLLAGHGSVGMAWVTVAANLAVQALTAAYSMRTLRMRFTFTGIRLTLLRETTVFSSFVLLSVVIDQINWNVDKYIVGWFWGTAAVAVYGVASVLNLYFMSLSSAVSTVFAPRVHNMVASETGDRALSLLFARVGRIQFALLAGALIEFVIFGREFLVFWAGPAYESAYFIALLLMIPAVVPLIQNLGVEIQRAKNLHKFRAIVYSMVAIVNVLASIFLVRALGPVGAAIGTALSLLIGNGIIMNWYYASRVGLDLRHFWSQIVRMIPSLLAPTIVGLIFVWFCDTTRLIVFVAGILVVGFVYVVSVWCLGLDASERSLVRTPLARFRRGGS